jgi:hypothetical protein
MYYLPYNTVLVDRSFSGIMKLNGLDLAERGMKNNSVKKKSSRLMP